ncbi:MAG TPA: hypothetical protein VGG02_05625 [Chthoniobacterales bacterium]|jgi:hypothetical protein
MKPKRLSLLQLAAFFAASIATAAAGTHPVIVNGNFEKPRYPAHSINAGGGYGWTSSFMGAVAIVSGNIPDGQGRHYGVTPYGRQYLGLDPRTQEGFISRDSQSIPGFVAGQSYVFTIEAADSDGGTAPALDVLLSNNSDKTYFEQTYDLAVGGPYTDVIDFTPITINFTSPVTGTVTLSLTNVGVGTDPGSISIDKVEIAPAPGQ